MNIATRIRSLALAAALAAAGLPTLADACTRLVYKTPGGLVLTGRSMDFKTEIPANLWAFPRGMERFGNVGPGSVRWKSRYGSLIASSYDIASSDGMNEKGLVGNLLWLAGAKYPEFDGKQPGLSAALWLQYALDNFATVAEAVEAFRKESFVVVSSNIPGTDKFAELHLSLSDAQGDNAIFEYVDGKLVIHHSKDFVVMTNEPPYEQQLAISQYWSAVDGTQMLPGTNRASDRFARASFCLRALPRTEDARTAVATVFSIVRNASVPYGFDGKEGPNISTTRWRVVADQRNLVYYYESALSPNVVWVELNKLDFRPGAPVRKLALAGEEVYAGETSGKFVETKPFEFAGL